MIRIRRDPHKEPEGWGYFLLYPPQLFPPISKPYIEIEHKKAICYANVTLSIDKHSSVCYNKVYEMY